MNTYTTEFFQQCPNNGVRVKYHLKIEADRVIPVEQIVSAVEILEIDEAKFHEEYADELAARLPGTQTLTAHHHGVDIQTIRQGADREDQ